MKYCVLRDMKMCYVFIGNAEKEHQKESSFQLCRKMSQSDGRD